MQRIRQANIGMALAVIALAALWLTLLNPEAISARSQLARILDGRTRVAEMDLYGFQNWGLAGQAALATLQTAAASRPDLAARLTALASGQDAQVAEPDPAAVRAALAAALPVVPDQPATRALRDRLLALLPVADLQGWQADCDAHLPQGGPGCVLVVADFLPTQDGDEAMLLARGPDGYMVMEGFALSADSVIRHSLTTYDGDLPQFQSGAAAIAALQAGLPPLSAVPLNQIKLPGQSGLLFAP
jgi:hypothetical protein